MENNRNCLVVGGSGVMGQAICALLARSGFTVTASFNKSLVKNFDSVHIDVTDEISITKAVNKIKPLYLVYTAGADFAYQSIFNISWSRIQNQLDLLVRGGWYCLKAALPYMEEAKFGRVVFINSSVSWGTPPPSMADYTIGRLAQQGLMKAAAVELGNKGITVNSVSPGLTESKSIINLPEIVKRMAAGQNPRRRLGKAEDIANVVAFLLREESGYINGADIPVAGGAIMR